MTWKLDIEVIYTFAEQTSEQHDLYDLFLLRKWVIFFGFDSLEEKFAEKTDLLTPKEVFFGWKNISYEGFICFLPLFCSKIAQENVEVNVMQLIRFCL